MTCCKKAKGISKKISGIDRLAYEVMMGGCCPKCANWLGHTASGTPSCECHKNTMTQTPSTQPEPVNDDKNEGYDTPPTDKGWEEMYSDIIQSHKHHQDKSGIYIDICVISAIKSFITSLLGKERDKYKEELPYPMGISQWERHGAKYHYDEFLLKKQNKKWIEIIRTLPSALLDDLLSQAKEQNLI